MRCMADRSLRPGRMDGDGDGRRGGGEVGGCRMQLHLDRSGNKDGKRTRRPCTGGIDFVD